MLVANATGCSSIWGGTWGTIPYTVNAQGHGPAWANSLFEDNAEFGLGYRLTLDKQREFARALLQRLRDPVGGELVDELLSADQSTEAAIEAQRERVGRLNEILDGHDSVDARDLRSLSDALVRKSVWCIGGDGWAYDIGFGGLDHVLASGRDINLLVLDTEVYSNTGGQASKSTSLGAVAKYAVAGKPTPKKDLGMMMMTYGYVYVAQVAMGADNAQCLKAIREAEAYPGPSLIVAYAPCINHGLKAKGGMGKSQAEEAKAVACGYWNLWRYDPRLEEEGKNPFQLDSKEPNWDEFQAFLEGEVRYLSLKKVKPIEAQELFDAAKKAAQRRYNTYARLSKIEY